ncbi:glycosyltransferase [bacterium]|nr:glycosyltransferase [bacterium]
MSPVAESRQWWDERFKDPADAEAARRRTRTLMEALIGAIPGPERAKLETEAVQILDWGCGLGDGTEALAQSFPNARVRGLELAAFIVDQAKQLHPDLEFAESGDGTIAEPVDVIVACNCLQFLDRPIEAVARLIPSCRDLFVAIVPFNEFPLPDGHRSQFREESFPARLAGFSLISREEIETAGARYIAAFYGSSAHMTRRNEAIGKLDERKKWDDYYRALPTMEETDALRSTGLEFIELVHDLLPDGGSTLEAGCGAGWQSLALARTRQYDVNLLDFSAEALSHARRYFERESLKAKFEQGDVFTTGEPQYDLVFNSGVLEHYTFEEQVRFVRGMASRSKGFVLALVPNRDCYWYWIWRLQEEARGAWPYGKEVPQADLSEAFKEAGLHNVCHAWLGADWSEDFILNLRNIDEELRQAILAVHRNKIIPAAQRAYLYVALGMVGKEQRPIAGNRWKKRGQGERLSESEANARLVDALALVVNGQTTASRLMAEAEGLKQQIAQRDQIITERDRLIAERDHLIAERDQIIAERDRQIAERAEMDNNLLWKANQYGELAGAIVDRDKRIAGLEVLLTKQLPELGEMHNRFAEALSETERLKSGLDASLRQSAETAYVLAEHDQSANLQASLLTEARTEIEKLRTELGKNRIPFEEHVRLMAERDEETARMARVLDEFRRELQERDTRIAEMADRIADRDAAMMDMQEDAAVLHARLQQEEMMSQLKTEQLDNLQSQLGELKNTVGRQQQELDRLNATVKSQLERLRVQEQDLRQAKLLKERLNSELYHAIQHGNELEQNLQTVLNSPGWRFALKVAAARKKILPLGGRRDRLFNWTVRKLLRRPAPPQQQIAAPGELRFGDWKVETNIAESRRDRPMLLEEDKGVRFPLSDPERGDAIVFSRTISVEPGRNYKIMAEIPSNYPNEAFAGRFEKRLYVEGELVWSRDLCLPADCPVLVNHTPRQDRIDVRVEMATIGDPEPGWDWGKVAALRVGLFQHQQLDAILPVVANPELQRIIIDHAHCRGIIVYPPLIDWGWMKQRPHHLLQQFARSGYLVLFCTHQLKTDKVSGFKEVEPNLFLVEKEETLYDLPEPWILVSNPRHLVTIRKFNKPRIIYDCLDNLRVHSLDGVPDPDVWVKHNELLSESEVVLVTCEQLRDEVGKVRPDAINCPNAVTYEDFHLTHEPKVPADLAPIKALGKPIVGYYGAMAKWFDYELLREVARMRTDLEFVLIGVDYDGAIHEQGLDKFKNIHWLGEKPYGELPAYLHLFDVATIPFVINDITMATSPVKMYEYMAGGKPIVTTPMPECERQAGVLIGATPTEFSEKLDDALKLGRDADYLALLDREARDNTWAARFDKIHQKVFRPRFVSLEQVVAHAAQQRGAMIFLLSIGWRIDLFQRPHHLARYFSREGFVSIYDCSAWEDDFFGFKEIEPNLYLYRGPEEELRKIPSPTLWTFCYNFARKDNYPADARIVYDLIDDFSVHPFDLEMMAANNERALEEADVICYVAHQLEKFLPGRDDKIYLPNGVEDWRFAAKCLPPPEEEHFDRLIAEKKPIIGYYGAIAEWFDYDLLAEVARLRPDWNFLLIGPDYDKSMHGHESLDLPNVTWIGPRDYKEIPSWLQAFDVAMIPFKINDITLATSPLKLYEYFAGGKPVITTPMPECMLYPEVHIVKDAAEFSKALDKALAENRDPKFRAKMRALGADNSWQARVRTVIAALGKVKV